MGRKSSIDRLDPEIKAYIQAMLASGSLTLDELIADLQARCPWLTETHAWRLAHSYGTRARDLLGEASGLDALGQHFGADLYQAEVDYLVRHEWVTEAEDVLWRRSKLGLRIDAQGVRQLTDYLARRFPKNDKTTNPT